MTQLYIQSNKNTSNSNTQKGWQLKNGKRYVKGKKDNRLKVTISKYIKKKDIYQ